MKVTIDTEKMTDEEIDRLIVQIDKARLALRVQREAEREVQKPTCRTDR